MSDSERERTMVHDLLELKSKVDLIITKAFQSNEKFLDMIREAFESVINRRQNKPAELIGEKLLLRSLKLFSSLLEAFGYPLQKNIHPPKITFSPYNLFVAKYVDTQLKSGNKEWSDEQLDRQLDKVMVLFRYIHGMGSYTC